MSISADVRTVREDVVRRHMESENVHDFEPTIATFAHPRYELIATDRVYVDEPGLRAVYFDTATNLHQLAD